MQNHHSPETSWYFQELYHNMFLPCAWFAQTQLQAMDCGDLWRCAELPAFGNDIPISFSRRSRNHQLFEAAMNNNRQNSSSIGNTHEINIHDNSKRGHDDPGHARGMQKSQQWCCSIHKPVPNVERLWLGYVGHSLNICWHLHTDMLLRFFYPGCTSMCFIGSISFTLLIYI